MSELRDPNLPNLIADSIAALYGFKREAVAFITISQNYVFRIATEDRLVIARVTEPDHRSRSEIIAELEWIDFLKSHRVNACGPVEFDKRDICETLESNDRQYHCVLFEHAPGRPLSGADLAPTFYRNYGKLLGQLHRLSMQYDPPSACRRPQWHENRLYTRDPEMYLPSEQSGVIELIKELVAKGKSLLKTNLPSALVHLDVHTGNIFLDSGSLHLFDFDNCSYGFLANDIAKALHASVFTKHRRESISDHSPFYSPLIDEALAHVCAPFWEGYGTEISPDAGCLEALPLFFMLVELKAWVHHYRCGTPDLHPSVKEDFLHRLELIEDRILPVQFDFVQGRPADEPIII